jgi:predicted nucleic acid-binding protein
MRIILDTNIVFRDFYFSSPASRTLLSGMAKANHSLYVPKVIFDEIVNKYLESVGELLGKAKRLGFSGLAINDSVVNELEQARSSYSEFLTRELKTVGARFLDYPTTSHEELVGRALKRRKPFRSTDTGGYRDALIWETIKILACEKPKETIAFISDNPKRVSEN